MTRRIPSVASLTLPDARTKSPRLDMLAGSASKGGEWFDIASIHNFNLAMHHAGPTHQQDWDGDFAFNVAGWTARYETTIPELSDTHTDLTFHVYGWSPSGGGQIRITATTSGSVVTIALPGALGWTTGATKLSVVGSFAVNDYETILVETNGSVDIEVVALEYDELRPLNQYPAADDELAAGVLIDGVAPIDTDEVAADQFLASEFATTLNDGGVTTAARVRTYSNGGSIFGIGFPTRPFRVLVPVWNLRPESHEVRYRLKVTADVGGGSDRFHLIQHTGTGTIEELQQQYEDTNAPFGYTQIQVVAGTGTTWVDDTITLLPGDILAAPGGYFGFAWLTIYPDEGLDSYAFWGI